MLRIGVVLSLNYIKGLLTYIGLIINPNKYGLMLIPKMCILIWYWYPTISPYFSFWVVNLCVLISTEPRTRAVWAHLPLEARPGTSLHHDDFEAMVIHFLHILSIFMHFPTWRFPKSWGYPTSHPFLVGISHEINHHWGTPMAWETTSPLNPNSQLCSLR